MAKQRKASKKKASKKTAAKKTAARKATTKRAKATRAPARKRVRPVPVGFNTVSVHLTVNDGNRALEFYQKAFGGKVGATMPGPGGALLHGEVQIGNSTVMIAEEMPGGQKAPTSLGGTPCVVSLYVTDADEFFIRAAQAGARVTQPLENQFWGDRYGQLTDPFGHVWAVATHIEDRRATRDGETDGGDVRRLVTYSCVGVTERARSVGRC